MTQTYVDPTNLQEELSLISTFKTLEDVKTHIELVFPKWYIGMINTYSTDYTVLDKNWKDLCEQINTSPKAVVIISDDNFMSPDHSLSRVYCELFTKLGFCIRRSSDLITCTVCHSGIPREHLYNLLKDKCSSDVPAVWANKCSTCM
jgi:hypothetical protein